MTLCITFEARVDRTGNPSAGILSANVGITPSVNKKQYPGRVLTVIEDIGPGETGIATIAMFASDNPSIKKGDTVLLLAGPIEVAKAEVIQLVESIEMDAREVR